MGRSLFSHINPSHHPIHRLSVIKTKWRSLSRRAYLRHCLQTVPLTEFSMEQIARDRRVISHTQLTRLFRQINRMGVRLAKQQCISEERWQEIVRIISETDLSALEEALSPYHLLLADKPFYHRSAPITRRILRKNIAAFAKRHRLSPESAALLWNGEARTPPRHRALLLLCPIPLALGILIVYLNTYSLQTALWAVLSLPTVFWGGYLLSATLLQRWLPSSPLPLLESGEGHPTVVVGIGRLQDSSQALKGMERILCAGNSDCRYLLLLFHSDALLPHCSGEEEMEKEIRQSLSKLEEHYDVTLDLLLLPRSFDSRRKKWMGNPDFSRISSLLTEHLSPTDEAVCILPTDATILPGTIERLCAAMFHPLFKGNSLSFLELNSSPLPKDRLAKLRRVLLQKMDAPADFNGYGMLHRNFFFSDSQHSSQMLRPRLSAETLYCTESPMPLCHDARKSPLCYPILSAISAVCHPLLLWGMIHHAVPFFSFFSILTISLSDLWVSMLLSMPQKMQGHWLYTLPSLKRLGKEIIARLVFPMKGISECLGKRKSHLFLPTFLFGCAVIASGAPLSFLGICWIVAPFLLSPPSEHRTLSPMEKAACHALAKEIFDKFPIDANTPPPTNIDLQEQSTSCTTPLTMGLYASAMLSAFSLGLCDHHTFQRQIAALLDYLEKIPHKCGLPYAKYNICKGDEYEEVTVDSYQCGMYALCLAELEAGLREYSLSHPQWTTLAERVNRISTRMDFQLLLTSRGEICHSLAPTGEQVGKLSSLCEKGGIALFAALSSDSLLSASPPISTGCQKKIAFEKLRSPHLAAHKGELSAAKLQDHLIPLLFLPIPSGSLIDYGADSAIRRLPRSNRSLTAPLFRLGLSKRPSDSPRIFTTAKPKRFCSLLRWPHLTMSGSMDHEKLPSINDTSLRGVDYCLLLRKKPRYALAHLQLLQQATPTGGFGDSESPHGLSTDDLALALIALESAIRPIGFFARIQSLPRCACLTPLLHHATQDSSFVSSVQPSTVSPDLPRASLFLLGDAQHGLLVNRWNTITLWENGRAITASQEIGSPFADGRPTGILLRRGTKGSPLFYDAAVENQQILKLSHEDVVCHISSEHRGIWQLQLRQSKQFTADFRWIFCPASKPSQPVRLTTVVEPAKADLRLVIESTSSLTIVLEIAGLDHPFTYADPSPLPKGIGQIDSIFQIKGSEASGICHSPVCIIGGLWTGEPLLLRIAIASTASEALRRLDLVNQDSNDERLPLSSPILPHSPNDKQLDLLTLTYYLTALFAGNPLPKRSAVGSIPLGHSLENVVTQLSARGFPMAQTLPEPLLFSRREGAEGMLCRLLTTSPRQAETVLLPGISQIDYSDGYLHIKRGRDLPSITHAYANDALCLHADPCDLRLTTLNSQFTISIRLLLSQGNHQWLLPEACTEIRYLPGKAFFQGDGFCLTVALLPDLPLLTLELCANGSAELSIAHLAAPDKTADGVSFWHLSDHETLFSTFSEDSHRKAWFIGIFPREQDRLYYQMRETVTPHTYTELLRAHSARLQSAAETLLVWEREEKSMEDQSSPTLPPLSAIALAILSAPSPVKALLSPLCTPERAKSDLLSLAMSPPSLLLPTALLIYWAIFPDDTEVIQTPISHGQRSESLYLHAARCIEDAMENAPETPLLPLLVSAFSGLAQAVGDPTASLYAAFTPPSDIAYPSLGKDPYWNCGRNTIQCLADLVYRTHEAADAIWEAIGQQLLQPSWEDSALLWCGVLWNVLGFHPHKNDADFSPMELSRPCEARLIFGREHQIALSSSAKAVQFQQNKQVYSQNYSAKT